MQPGSIWRNTANKRQYLVVSVGRFARSDVDYIVHREWPISDGPDQIMNREDWERVGVSPVCTSCGDNQRWSDGSMCTACPIPCERCRGAQGAFCHHTPCTCACHLDNWQYRKWKPPQPLFVKEMCDTGDNRCMVCNQTQEGNLK